MSLFDFVLAKHRKNESTFNIVRDDEREIFSEIYDMFQEFPVYITFKKARYLVTLEHDHLAACDISCVSEYFTFTNEMHVPSQNLRKVL
ncbi:hypothetical protein VPDG_00148 [Vibrio phage henriette 12B8]|uniref:hypothetical protein n=1 Tax=Vibrio phage henriette 12B8 TaxID=573174 RepID=UPI0002C0C069|nr:hypothetical protein VPDG_00148 [Vibrio phage henriette 12B8]AGG58309.1 hypothetical protein VPDG_00148 [Vibrio phage henriette 12B8]